MFTLLQVVEYKTLGVNEYEATVLNVNGIKLNEVEFIIESTNQIVNLLNAEVNLCAKETTTTKATPTGNGNYFIRHKK